MSEDPLAKRPADDEPSGEPSGDPTRAYGTPPPPPSSGGPAGPGYGAPGYGAPGYGAPDYPAGGYVSAGYGGPAPFGIDPATGIPYSDKTKLGAGLLQLVALAGVPGIGRLYAGHTTIGLIQLIGAAVSYVAICILIGLFTVWGFLLWSVIDGIIILASSSPRDGQGRVLRP